MRAALPAVNAESDAPSATTDKAANSPPPSQAARQPDVGGRRYPRKVAPSAKQHEADAGAHFLAAMRAHFQEVSVGMCLVSAWCLNVSRALINGKDKVALLKGQLGGHRRIQCPRCQVDAFDLAVETPSPAAPVRRQASPPTAEAALPPAGGQPLIDRLAAAAAVQDAPASSPGASLLTSQVASMAGIRIAHGGAPVPGMLCRTHQPLCAARSNSPLSRFGPDFRIQAPSHTAGKPGSPAAAELSSLAGRARHSGISFGLSRRRSSMVSHPPPPHRCRCACVLPAYGHMACTACTARLHGDRLPATRWQLLMRFEQRQTKIARSYE